MADPSKLNLTPIKFGERLEPELFNSIARDAAQSVAFREDGRPKNENKPTQLRRFYDELVLWETRVSQQPDKFDDFLPFIRMINAKDFCERGRRSW